MIMMIIIVMLRMVSVPMPMYQVSSVGGDHDEGEEPPKGGDHPGREGTENSSLTYFFLRIQKTRKLRKHLSSDKLWWMIRPIQSHIYSFHIRPKCSYLRFVKLRSFIFAYEYIKYIFLNFSQDTFFTFQNILLGVAIRL